MPAAAQAGGLRPAAAALHRFTDLLGKNFLIVVTAFRALFLVGAQSGFYQSSPLPELLSDHRWPYDRRPIQVAVPPGTAGFLKLKRAF